MRNIPENNLAYPILVTWDTGSTGSGFRLRVQDKTFFVTAKHVLFDEHDNLRGNSLTLLNQTSNIDNDCAIVFNVDMRKIEANGMLYKHANYDIAGFLKVEHEIKDGKIIDSKEVEGVDIIKDCDDNLVSVNAEIAVNLMKDVMISNDIYLYGYPSSLGLKQSPQFDYEKPLLRKGIVANIQKSSGTIILDCPVYYGNSGGPVVQVDFDGKIWEHKVIGVVSQFIPYSEHWRNLSNNIIHTEISNSGYSVAVAMDYVFEMFGVKK